MKLFEEFENDLENVFNTKDLVKVMLANGVKSISANEEGIAIEITVAGLILNVPKDKWEILVDGNYVTSIGVKNGIYSFVCNLNNSYKEEFTKATGFDFKVVE